MHRGTMEGDVFHLEECWLNEGIQVEREQGGGQVQKERRMRGKEFRECDEGGNRMSDEKVETEAGSGKEGVEERE